MAPLVHIPPFFPGATRYFSYARHALHAALQLLDIQAGQRVLIPAFICRDLLAPIHAVGAEPVLYAVDQQLRPMALPEAQNVRAVIAVNYFGFAQDLKPFRIYCEQHSAVLIEDNAHGFLSQDEAGVALGTRGDFGLFSMRKTFALPDGAALFVNNPAWQSRLQPQLPCREEPLPLAYWVKRSLAQAQYKTGIPALALAQDLTRSLRRWYMGSEVAPSLPESEYEMPPISAPHCSSLGGLSELDAGKEIARRRELYLEFHAVLATLAIQPVFADMPVGTTPYGYPFYADNQAAQAVTKIARTYGLDCIHWPDLPTAVASDAPQHYRSLWLVNFLC